MPDDAITAGATRSLDFDSSCHSADAIQRAAYLFTDRFAMTIAAGDGIWHCTLDFAAAQTGHAEVVRAFQIEVLDQVLRERIRAETAPVRNAILALAFSQVDIAHDAPDAPTS